MNEYTYTTEIDYDQLTPQLIRELKKEHELQLANAIELYGIADPDYFFSHSLDFTYDEFVSMTTITQPAI